MKLVTNLTQSSNPKGLQVAPRRFRINSLGFRLFLVITGGILVGMGGMSLLFGETVKFQAEDQIKATLRNKKVSNELRASLPPWPPRQKTAG